MNLSEDVPLPITSTSSQECVGTSSYADVARRAGEMMVSQSNKEHVRVSKKME
jgi:hypothetical protein